MLAVLIPLVLAAPQAEEPRWIDLFLEGSRALERGDLEKAENALECALELQPRHSPTAWQLAGVSARAGDADAALDWLESAVDWGGGEAALLEWDPDLASLREEARLGVLLDQLRSRDLEQPIPLDPGAHLGGFDQEFWSSSWPQDDIVVHGRHRDTYMRDRRTGGTLAVLNRRGETVQRVAVHPNGRWVVAAANTPERVAILRVFDGATGDLVRELPGTLYSPGVQFSADGARLLTVGRRAAEIPKGAVVWDTETWTPVAELPADCKLAALSPDGKTVVVLSAHSAALDSGQCEETYDVSLWRVDGNHRVAQHRVPRPRLFKAPEFSTDSSLLLVLEFRGGGLLVYDVESGEKQRHLAPGEVPFRDACFIGGTGAIATSDEQGSIGIWTAQGMGIRRIFKALDEEPFLLDASPDGRTLLAWRANALHVFDTGSGNHLWTSDRAPGGDVQRARHSPDGARVMVNYWNEEPCVVHDARSGEVLSVHQSPRLRSIIRPHPERNELWVGLSDGTLRRIDAATGRALRSWRHGRAPITGMCFTADGGQLAFIDRDGITRVINTRSGELSAKIRGGGRTYGGRYGYNCEFSPEGSTLLVDEPRGALHLYRTSDWTLRCSIQPKPTSGERSWRADGGLLAVSVDKGLVRLFDTQSGEPLEIELQVEHWWTSTIGFEPRGNRLWVADNDSTVHVFDTESGEEVQTLSQTDIALGEILVRTIIFSEDGELAVTASQDVGVIAGWHPESGRRLWDYNYSGGTWAPVHAAFGQNGERVYVWGQGDHTPRIVNARDGSTLIDLEERGIGKLLPLPDERLVAALGPEGLEVIETGSGQRRWARIEVENNNWLLCSPTHHIDGSRHALEQLHLVLPDRSYPLDALATALLDPKKVRATAKGVELAPAQLPTIPELQWEIAPPRVVRIGEDREQPTVSLVASCPDGVAGFELQRDGKRSRVEGKQTSTTERRLTLQLDRPESGGEINYRWRAVSTTGVLSRALHLTVESGP